MHAAAMLEVSRLSRDTVIGGRRLINNRRSFNMKKETDKRINEVVEVMKDRANKELSDKLPATNK